MIHTKIELKESSQSIELVAVNTYTKGPLYCVFVGEGRDQGKVQKFPLANIWRVTEEYK